MKRNEGNLEIRFPFLSVFYYYSICIQKIPQRLNHCNAAHLSTLLIGVKGSHLVSVGACLHLQWSHECTFTPLELGAESELTVTLFHLLCLCPQGSVDSVYLSLHHVGKGSDTDTVCIFVCDHPSGRQAY